MLFTFVVTWNELLIARVILPCIPPLLFVGLLTRFLNRCFQPRAAS